MTPQISVIIPVYNVEKYLDDCVRSVLNQSFQNFEIILVDDGSTDTSGQLCDDWAKKDERIVVIHIPNSGVSVARNTGAQKALGKYIYFLDSDDFIAPFWLEELHRIMEDTSADIVKGGICYVKDSPSLSPFADNIDVYKTISFKSAETLSSYEYLVRLIDHEGYNCVTNHLAKAELHKKCPLPVGRRNEDQRVYFDLLKHTDKIVLCQSAGLYYRQRAGSVTSTMNNSFISNMVEDYIDHAKILEQDYNDTEHAKAALVRATELFFFYLASAQRMEAIKSDLTKSTWKKLFPVTKNYDMKQLLPKVLFFQYKIYSISDSLYYQIMHLKKAVSKQ